MSPPLRVALLFATSLGFVIADASLTLAAEQVRGPVRVCRKPMLAGNAALAALVKPGPDAWRLLAERQAEEAKYCYIAGNIELIEKGQEIDVGGNTKCTEWEAFAATDRVYVVIGPSRTWGSCP